MPKRRRGTLTKKEPAIRGFPYQLINEGKYIQVDYLPPYRADTGVPNGQKDAVGTGNALLVYQQGQDISFGPVEGNCGRTVGVIPDSHPSTLDAALSFQTQTTIIPGEKMVVIHPGRHH